MAALAATKGGSTLAHDPKGPNRVTLENQGENHGTDTGYCARYVRQIIDMRFVFTTFD